MKFNQFEISQNHNRVSKYLSDGSIEYGKFLIGEDGLPHFFTINEISMMVGIGVYSGGTGYNEYHNIEKS